ncbi:MAG TPA: aminotransferase class III-fold pyridoxal phosphate-dependent enzyme [Vicinamibacterales bacterium]|nr:aminotransferase class III-fold pyridoxal phosphate-dependent enzyme [Vicinamibacterales bacterium]
MKAVAIIQARMASTRLPGKILVDLAGKPLLLRVVERVRRARTLDQVVVATTSSPADDEVETFCTANDIPCFRGSEEDVLDRYYQAARAHHADIVVRITGDCPLIDPAVIDRVVAAYRPADDDYVANVFRYTWPDGLDTEVFGFHALERAWRDATKPSEREHVTSYLRTSGSFRTRSVENEIDLSSRNYRWTVDDPVDLEFVRDVYGRLASQPEFGFEEVVMLLEKSPALAARQSGAIRNEGYYKTLFDQATAGAAPKRPMDKSREWGARASKVIPGCAQTFSKGYTQFVQGVSPIFLSHGKGARVWDVDGNEYIDFIQGLLPNILGYAHDEVNAAAAEQLGRGHSFSLPHPLEVELAERLTRLIPCAEMVRFGKNGSDATAGAVRGARAFTGRERIACSGYHGWQDWYIGTTARHKGVPGAVRALTHPFPYHDLNALETLLTSHAGEFAAVIMEPVNFTEPKPGYLECVKALAHKHGALLIFDEICTGFHMGLGGAQKKFGVTPDMACFGKAMGNGFPIACVVGRADVMKIFEEVFFSFTFGGEVASLAACMKVLDILEGTDALHQMETNGQRIQEGFNAIVKHAGLTGRFECIGYPVWSLMKFRDASGVDSMLERSLFQQETVKRGLLLLVTHNMTSAHDDAVIERTLEVYAEVFKTLAVWLADPDPSRFLEGPAIQPVFKVR